MSGGGRAAPRCGRAVRRLWGLTIALAACRAGEEPQLRVVETVSLDLPGAATLAIDSAGDWWLGRPGRLAVRDSAGAVTQLSTPGRIPARVLGWSGERVHLRWGDSVAVFDAVGDSLLALREGFGSSSV